MLPAKFISFSIYGCSPRYTVGLIKNIELIPEIYPEWKVLVFTDGSPGDSYLRLLGRYEFVQVIMVTTKFLPGRFWRFLVPEINRAWERFIVRDADSRVSKRDASAVKEWEDSGRTLHIMRDHPHHDWPIMAGMWGLKNVSKIPILDLIKTFNANHKGALEGRTSDQIFLAKMIYPYFRDSILAHTSYHSLEADSRSFPTPLIDFRFVGEIYDFVEYIPYASRDAALLSLS